MSNKKQSSVEQKAFKSSLDLLLYYLPSAIRGQFKEQIEQAKAMHKEEMRDLYLTHVTKAERLRKIFEKQFEELYNETFGGEK